MPQCPKRWLSIDAFEHSGIDSGFWFRASGFAAIVALSATVACGGVDAQSDAIVRAAGLRDTRGRCRIV